MKKQYEVFFVLMLIFIIGLFVLQLTGVSASFEERIHQEKEEEDNLRIASSYYFTKLKQHDAYEEIRTVLDRVYLVLDGMETCIFWEDGVLYESNVVEGVEHSVNTAFTIAEVDAVNISKKDGIWTIEIENNGRKRAIKILLKAAAR